MFLLCFLAILSTLAFLFYKKLRHVYKEVEHIPGPPLKPLFGNAQEIGTNSTDFLRNIKRLSKQYGPVVRLCVGWRVIVLISEPKYILQAIELNDEKRTPDFYEGFLPLFGKGLFTISGDTWTRHRKILNKLFSTKHLAKYTTIFNRNADTLVNNLSKKVGPHSIDVTHEIYICTLNTICNVVMQVDVSENIEFQTAADGLLDLGIQRYFSLPKKILYCFTKDFKLQQKYMRTLDEFYDLVLARRKMHINSDEYSEDNSAIIDDLLKLEEEDTFTHEEMRGEMQSLIVAGSETVGSTMTFILFELAKHPDIQEKILEEAQQVLGANKENNVSFEDLHRLKFTESVVKETLRLYGPGYVIPKQLGSEAKFGDMTIPAGANILLNVGSMHLSPDYYPNPEKFIPERFLVEDAKDNRLFMPFSIGPKICLGHKFAVLEAKVFVVKLVRHFELLPVQPEHQMVLKLEGVVKSANGVPIILKLRQ